MNKKEILVFSGVLVLVLVFLFGVVFVFVSKNDPIRPSVESNENAQNGVVSTDDNVKEGVNDIASSSFVELRTKRYKSLKRETIISSVDTSNWQTYKNEEYGFEFKYPDGWYWEDYSEDFRYPMFGFYKKGKKRGYEYYGDIAVGLSLDQPYDNIVGFYEMTINGEIIFSDTVKLTKNMNNHEVLFVYNEPSFYYQIDSAKMFCNQNAIVVDSFFTEVNRDKFEAMVASFVCF